MIFKSLTERIRTGTFKPRPTPPKPSLDDVKTWRRFSTAGEYPTSFAVCPLCMALVSDNLIERAAHAQWHSEQGKGQTA